MAKPKLKLPATAAFHVPGVGQVRVQLDAKSTEKNTEHYAAAVAFLEAQQERRAARKARRDQAAKATATTAPEADGDTGGDDQKDKA